LGLIPSDTVTIRRAARPRRAARCVSEAPNP
jgi:hypothetical protein